MKIVTLILAAAVLGVATPAMAQSANQAQANYSAGPWKSDAVVGIQHRSVIADIAANPALEVTRHQGQPIALMVVGGAAILIGALTDNGASGLLIVGGTLVGLYGLYEYLR